MRSLMWDSEFRALESVEEDWIKNRVPESYSSWIANGRPNVRTSRLSQLALDILGVDSMARAFEAATTSSMKSIPPEIM